MNRKMPKRMIGAACGTALLIAAAVVVALRDRRREVSLPDVPVAQTPAEVRVKAVERKGETLDFSNVAAAKFPNKRPRRAAPEFGILLPETA